MTTMYNSMINSPITTLSSGIGASDTTIPLIDSSKLPSAPNICTLGTDETAETVLYTGISGNNLTGVTRGFQGTAKAWNSGTIAARYYTAYDHNSFVDNITNLQNMIYAPKTTRANRTSTFDVTDSTWFAVSWNNEVIDQTGAFDVSNPTKIIVPSGYTRIQLKCYIVWSNSSTGNRLISIRKNGTTTIQVAMQPAVNESGQIIDTGWINCVAGDYYEVVCLNGITSVDILGSDSWGGGSWFEATWAKL